MFQQTFKNFSVSFDALNEGNTVSSGDPVAGHVSFDLTKSTKITSITMTLRGRAHVHWSTGGGGGGRRRRRRRRNCSAKVDFFNVGSAVLRENGASATKLQPGTHVYPFTCQLPEGDFPSTFRGVHGHTAYTLTMGINRQWRLSKDFVTELNYVNRIDTNQPELQAPLLGSNSMTVCSMWCAWFPIAMTVRTEKKAFVPGETVKMICEFSNASSGTATPKVKLQQKQVYYTHNKINKSECVKNLASVTGQPVSAHTSDVHTEIMVTIPLFAPLTISNCSILHVDYIIEVSLSVRASPNLVVLFPIILCDTPVNAHP